MRRRHVAIAAELDRCVALAAPETDGETGSNVVGSSRGHLELLPDEGYSGGYFQSEDTVKLKLGITITSLENGRWSKVAGRVEECLHQLNAKFQMRFESED
jgi:hypothetical protein